jgi:hypothetical protein
MSKDPYVSPNLLRPLRSYEQALREQEDRKSRAATPGTPASDEGAAVQSADAGNPNPGGKDR